jgi:hypothetical protein
MSNGIQLTQNEKLICIRAHRLQQLVTTDGYQDLKQLLQEIVDETLAKLDLYDGDEDHKTAVLAFQWKTAKAIQEKLLGRITQHIHAGERVALSKVPAELLNKTAEPVEFAGVRPQCDVDDEPLHGASDRDADDEALPDAPPKPPISS